MNLKKLKDKKKNILKNLKNKLLKERIGLI